LRLEPLEDRRLLSVMFKTPEFVKDINQDTDDSYPSGPGYYGDPYAPVEIGGMLYFSATDGQTGYELWQSDGTHDGTQQVADIQEGEMGSSPRFMINIDGMLYFTASDGQAGNELWRHNPATGVTELFVDVVTGVDANGRSYSSSPGELTYMDGSLFFTANHPDYGRELWKTDLATRTTEMTDIFTGTNAAGRPNDSSPQNLTELNGTLFFSATNGTPGHELWKGYDDETTGQWVVEQVKDIAAGNDGPYTDPGAPSSSNPYHMVALDGQRLFLFSADDEYHGRELWKSDGTASGTSLIRDIRLETEPSSPGAFTRVADTTFFVADDRVHGKELWKTDGTADGTQLVRDNGNELWKSYWDETANGGNGAWVTEMLKDILPGFDEYGYINSSYPSELTDVGGTLFFSVAVQGDFASYRPGELWQSDGTEAGTQLVQAFPTAGGSGFSDALRGLVDVDGQLFFAAADFDGGVELWTSNGTTTERVMDINAGIDGSFPQSLTNAGGDFFFSADNGTTGQELWWAEQDRPPVAVGEQYKVAQNGMLDLLYPSLVEGVSTEFAEGGGWALGVDVQSDGAIVVAGGVTVEVHDDVVGLTRYQAGSEPFAGVLDTTFGGDGRVTTNVASSYDNYAEVVIVQSDGKILVAGENDDDFALLRYNSDGSLDASFGGGTGIVTTDFNSSRDWATAVAVQADGKYVVAGHAGIDFALARYNIDGSLDVTFDTDGKVITDFSGGYGSAWDVAIQSDGKIIAAGYADQSGSLGLALARYNNDGSLDDTYGTGGLVWTDALPFTSAYDMVIQLDDKIVVAGDPGSDFVAARFDIFGNLDTEFGTDGVVITNVGSGSATLEGVALQSDGKIVLAGDVSESTPYTSERHVALTRYDDAGNLDTTFGVGGVVTTDFSPNSWNLVRVYDVAIAPDDKIVIAGEISSGQRDYDFLVARYTKDGSLDVLPAGVLARLEWRRAELLLGRQRRRHVRRRRGRDPDAPLERTGRPGDRHGFGQNPPPDVGPDRGPAE